LGGLGASVVRAASNAGEAIEQPIRPARGGLGSAALIHGQLLPKGEVLERDGTMSANEESGQPKSLHEPDDHGQR
jgi:hypothetical protein